MNPLSAPSLMRDKTPPPAPAQQSRVVKPRAPSFLHRRLGMALALLALLAQFWMGQASTGHMAQMLAMAGGGICSAQADPMGSMAAADNDGNSHRVVDAFMHCPVCAVAALSTLANHHGPLIAAPVQHAIAPLGDGQTPPRTLRHTHLYPPAHAPPQA